MRLPVTIVLLLGLMVVLTACDSVDVSKMSDTDLQRIAENIIVCNAPYMRYGTDCCLDQNNNGVCDGDESENVPSEQQAEPSVPADTPEDASNTEVPPSNRPDDAAHIEESTHMMDDGEPTPKVSFVAFIDYEEPWSRRYRAEIEPQLIRDYVETGKMRYSVRYFPMTAINPYAQVAAEAAECAGQQYGFWPMSDYLMTKPDSTSMQDYRADVKVAAAELGLDQQQFTKCLDTGNTTSIVMQDLQDAQDAGVGGVPTFYINGKPAMAGLRPYEEFKVAVDRVMS